MMEIPQQGAQRVYLPICQQGDFFFLYYYKVFLAVFQHPLIEQLKFTDYYMRGMTEVLQDVD